MYCWARGSSAVAAGASTSRSPILPPSRELDPAIAGAATAGTAVAIATTSATSTQRASPRTRLRAVAARETGGGCGTCLERDTHDTEWVIVAS